MSIENNCAEVKHILIKSEVELENYKVQSMFKAM